MFKHPLSACVLCVCVWGGVGGWGDRGEEGPAALPTSTCRATYQYIWVGVALLCLSACVPPKRDMMCSQTQRYQGRRGEKEREGGEEEKRRRGRDGEGERKRRGREGGRRRRDGEGGREERKRGREKERHEERGEEG